VKLPVWQPAQVRPTPVMSCLVRGLRQGAPEGSSIGPPCAKPIGSAFLSGMMVSGMKP
jgi:hypothetical protein